MAPEVGHEGPCHLLQPGKWSDIWIMQPMEYGWKLHSATIYIYQTTKTKCDLQEHMDITSDDPAQVVKILPKCPVAGSATEFNGKMDRLVTISL